MITCSRSNAALVDEALSAGATFLVSLHIAEEPGITIAPFGRQPNLGLNKLIPPFAAFKSAPREFTTHLIDSYLSPANQPGYN